MCIVFVKVAQFVCVCVSQIRISLKLYQSHFCNSTNYNLVTLILSLYANQTNVIDIYILSQSQCFKSSTHI